MPPATPVLFVATPCYGGQASSLYLRSLLDLAAACQARGVRLLTELGGGEALIGRGRAALMAKFLEGSATHLLFVDADIGFSPEAVFRLLDSGHPIVGGVYPKKAQDPKGPLALEVEPLPGGGREDLRPVRSVGAGFLLIARAAAERLVAGFPELRASLADVSGAAAPQASMIFDSFVDSGSGRYLSDYEALCHRWRALGGEIWADFASPLKHIGAIVHNPSQAAK